MHTLLWLKDAPSVEEMETLLKQPDFRERAKRFIRANICAHMTGLESTETMSKIPKDADVAYC